MTIGMLLQIAMVLWRHVNDLDQAGGVLPADPQEIDPAHPAALDFYRAFYTAKGESGELMTLLKSVEKGAPRTRGPSECRREIDLDRDRGARRSAEQSREGDFEAWKQHLRGDPASVHGTRGAVAALSPDREVERTARSDEGRHRSAPARPISARACRGCSRSPRSIAIDSSSTLMVINTYNAILKIDPENQRAGDEPSPPSSARSAAGTI